MEHADMVRDNKPKGQLVKIYQPERTIIPPKITVDFNI